MTNNLLFIKETFLLNINRIQNLLNIFDVIKTEQKKLYENNVNRDMENSDILRASVVFLHSAFENYYRSAVTLCLQSDKNIIIPNDISLPSNDKMRKSKFSVADLVKYKGKNVTSIINESIESHMDNISFNKFEDITCWAKIINIDLSEFCTGKENVENLSKMIARRHKIVHEADQRKHSKQEQFPKEQAAPTSINRSSVDNWIKIIIKLVECIESALLKNSNNI